LTLFLDTYFFNLPSSLRYLVIALSLLMIGGGAYAAKQLKLSGVAAAVVIGAVSMYVYGFTALFTFLFFFLSAAIIGKLSKRIRGIEEIQAKGGKRDGMQVIANGGPAALALLLYALSSSEIFLMVFASCIAEACSDTWAGDIGVLSKKEPISILTGKTVMKGLSGGISFLGTSAGLLGSLMVSCLYYSSFAGATLSLAAIAAGAAFFGCLADSFLGATVQAHYYDEERDMLTEHPVSKSGKQLRLARGIRFMNNDMVNLSSNMLTFLFAWGMSYLVG